MVPFGPFSCQVLSLNALLRHRSLCNSCANIRSSCSSGDAPSAGLSSWSRQELDRYGSYRFWAQAKHEKPHQILANLLSFWSHSHINSCKKWDALLNMLHWLAKRSRLLSFWQVMRPLNCTGGEWQHSRHTGGSNSDELWILLVPSRSCQVRTLAGLCLETSWKHVLILSYYDHLYPPSNWPGGVVHPIL